MQNDNFDIVGFTELAEVFKNHPDNFTELTFFGGKDPEPMSLNPKAFSVTVPVEDITKSSATTAKMLSDLFEISPGAKVFKIKVSPTMEPNKDWSPGNIGGTITISGQF